MGRRRRIGIVAAVIAALAGAAVTPTTIAPAAQAAEHHASAVSFDDGGLGGWTAFGTSSASITTLDDGAGGRFARIAGRATDYAGLLSPTGVLRPGSTYTLSMRLRLAPGAPDSRARFVVRPGYAWVGDTAVTASAWTTVTGTFTVPRTAEAASSTVYIGTQDTGTAYDYDVDDIRITTRTSLAGLAPFPVGVAIDQRETTGAAGAVVAEDFSQITAENHMKPDAWYDSARTLRIHPTAVTLMDFARRESLRVYGHTLVWHNQTPAWFFQDTAGRALTSSESDKQVLRDRLRAHVFGVAQSLSARYGAFGGGNPVVAFDVVNEVIDDGSSFSDGLRRSRWYEVLGEEFVDLAFRYADEAFNDTYAAAGSERPVTLVINDYGTEWDGKRARLKALVTRLLDRGVPVDAVGHQFHVGIDRPVSALEAALTDFSTLPVQQVVTELDATIGTVTPARLQQQKTWYRDAFAVFARNADRLFSVSVWGVNDGRSWVARDGAPLLFDDAFAPKPAYDGVAEALLAARPALVDEPLRASATASSRCAGGRVVVAVSITNAEAAGLEAHVSALSQSRDRHVGAGASASVSLSTRVVSVEAGTVAVRVAADVPGREAETTVTAPFAARSCG